MINSYFSDTENKILQAALSRRLNDVFIYTLHYQEGLKICAYIHMIFEQNISLIITTGSLADNIVLIDQSELEAEKERYVQQDGVEIKLNKVDIFRSIVGEKLIEIAGVQKTGEEYYWQMNFMFQTKVLNISALVDALEYSISPV